MVSVVAESQANDPDKAVDFLADDELVLEKEKNKAGYTATPVACG